MGSMRGILRMALDAQNARSRGLIGLTFRRFEATIMDTINLIPVGIVRSTRAKPSDDNWDAEQTRVELDPAQFTPEALAGLAEFSHVEVIFFMNQVDPGTVERIARHPRNNPNWPKVGI